MPRVVRAAARVIAVSEFTAGELRDLLAVPAAKIRVVPNAVEDVFTPEGPRGGGRLRARRRDARAAQEPRPDRGRRRRRAARRRRPRLGERRAARRTSTWLGEVGDDELAALYRGARCLVYASLYEGFGIPVAEALACGCPVVTTAESPMAELAGDDAVYVDPTDSASIRDGIARAAAAPPRRGATWADVARLTTEVYAEVA